MTTLNTNLAASGGGDDAQVDRVTAPPTVVVGGDPATAVVNGLGAQVRVLNGGGGDEIAVTGSGAEDTATITGSDSAEVVAVVAAGTDVVVDGVPPGVLTRLLGIEAPARRLGRRRRPVRRRR